MQEASKGIKKDKYKKKHARKSQKIVKFWNTLDYIYYLIKNHQLFFA